MKIMLLGSPGVGKGTQAEVICQHYNIPAISTGNILRAAIQTETALGQQAKSYLDQGKLLPDAVINGVVLERLNQADCANGFLLDGFPRTINQAETLIAHQIKLDYVLMLDVDDTEVVKRLSGRRTHLTSGRTYHIEYHPPKQENIDDVTGEPLIQRDDDKPEVIQQRLSVYHEQTAPLISFYQTQATQNKVKLIAIDGSAPVTQVSERIIAALSK